MQNEIGSETVTINGHPFKGIYRLKNGETVNAYFFDARIKPTSPLHAFIMFEDESNLVHILSGTNEIEEIFAQLPEMEEVPEDELRTTYCNMLLTYIKQNNLDLNESIYGEAYLEDQIVQSIYKENQRLR